MTADNDAPAKLDAAGAARFALDHGLTVADSVAFRGLTEPEAVEVADATAEADPMALAALIRRY
jgi:hypothetical protein